MRLVIDLRPYPGQTRTASVLEWEWSKQFVRAFPDWSFLLLLPENEKDRLTEGAILHTCKGPDLLENWIRLPRRIKSFKSDILLSFAPSPIRTSIPKKTLGHDQSGQGIILKGRPDLGQGRVIEDGVFDQIRGRFTQGRPYFVYFPDSRTVPDLTTVLRGFSIFKKWNQSSYKLVVLADEAGPMADKVRFQSYKYRDDVELIEDDDSFDREALVAGAFSIILDAFTPAYVFIGSLAAMHNIPVIGPHPLPFSCAFSETDTSREQALGEAMNRMYTSEGRWPVTPAGGDSNPVIQWEDLRGQLETVIG